MNNAEHGARELAKPHKVTVVWDDGKKQVYHYDTLEKANEIADGYKMSFGNQVWVGVD